MIEASKLRAGMTFVTNDGKLIKVLEASHHKPGKGNTIMRMKLRDVRSGSTFDTSYRPEEKFEQAIIGTEVIGVQVPTTVELTVTETQPSIKGATVTGSGKPATLETGLVVNVPDFIEAGQKLVINTAEGTYVSRA